jgi:hypothetical protein
VRRPAASAAPATGAWSALLTAATGAVTGGWSAATGRPAGPRSASWRCGPRHREQCGGRRPDRPALRRSGRAASTRRGGRAASTRRGGRAASTRRGGRAAPRRQRGGRGRAGADASVTVRRGGSGDRGCHSPTRPSRHASARCRAGTADRRWRWTTGRRASSTVRAFRRGSAEACGAGACFRDSGAGEEPHPIVRRESRCWCDGSTMRPGHDDRQARRHFLAGTCQSPAVPHAHVRRGRRAEAPAGCRHVGLHAWTPRRKSRQWVRRPSAPGSGYVGGGCSAVHRPRPGRTRRSTATTATRAGSRPRGPRRRRAGRISPPQQDGRVASCSSAQTEITNRLGSTMGTGPTSTLTDAPRDRSR